MSERYSRLFVLPENLYTAGAPVIIAAGALLKDNQTGKVLAQLKFRSISPKSIKGMKVCITPLDMVSHPLGENVAYQYLDLDVRRGYEFGQKTPISLPDATTRGFCAAVSEVVFTDNTIWQADEAQWENLQDAVPMNKAVSDPELQKQIRLEYGYSFDYMPVRDKDLWMCACGEFNHEGESRCARCGQELSRLLAMDMEALKVKRDARLAEEAAQAAQDRAAAQAKAKKTKKLAAIITPIAAVVIVASVLISGAMNKKAAYKEAMTLTDAGQLTEAIAMLEEAGYEDAENLVYGAAYAQAEALLDAGDYEAAQAVFKNLEGYSDSRERAMEAGYEEACKRMETGDYEAAKAAFEQLKGYSDSRAQAQRAAAKIQEAAEQAEQARLQGLYEEAENLLTQGDTVHAAMVFGSIADYQDARKRSFALWEQIVPRETIAAEWRHTVGLKEDGTVAAVGDNSFGQCDVTRWKDIISISTGGDHTVGLRANHMVVATGGSDETGWKDIVAISVGAGHTAMLKADGTVVGSKGVSDWKDIIAVSARGKHTVGLKADGTVVAVGDNRDGQCKVSGWRDIVAISTNYTHTVGLKKDGTVVAVGRNKYGECDVSDWTDIIAISAGEFHTVGLKADGTVVTVGDTTSGQCNVSDWNNIVAISADVAHTVGLKADGTVVAVGYNEYGQCDVSGWNNIRLPSTK